VVRACWCGGTPDEARRRIFGMGGVPEDGMLEALQVHSPRRASLWLEQCSGSNNARARTMLEPVRLLELSTSGRESPKACLGDLLWLRSTSSGFNPIGRFELALSDLKTHGSNPHVLARINGALSRLAPRVHRVSPERMCRSRTIDLQLLDQSQGAQHDLPWQTEWSFALPDSRARQ
jgi:hypothetical protein